MSTTKATIYHNPRCSTSRNTLALLRERGIEPQIIEYLKTPPSRDELAALVRKTGLPASELVRSKEPLFQELGLGEADVTEAQLLDAMAEHPILINRPVVVTPKGARLCRPIETVLEIL